MKKGKAKVFPTEDTGPARIVSVLAGRAGEFFPAGGKETRRKTREKKWNPSLPAIIYSPFPLLPLLFVRTTGSIILKGRQCAAQHIIICIVLHEGGSCSLPRVILPSAPPPSVPLSYLPFLTPPSTPSPPRDINGMVVCFLLGLLSGAILTSFLGLLKSRGAHDFTLRRRPLPTRGLSLSWPAHNYKRRRGEGEGRGRAVNTRWCLMNPTASATTPPPPPLRFLPLFTSPSPSPFPPLFRNSMFSFSPMSQSNLRT